jgi:2-methylcitrate dehydratase
MTTHRVRVHPSKSALLKEEQLAWKLAAVATDRPPVLPEVTEMIVNRVIDNAAVAIAAINRTPVANARTQALAHPRGGSGTGETPVPLRSGATLFGVPSEQRFDCELESLRPRARRKARHRSCGPRDAWREKSVADLRGRGQCHRVDAWRA